MTYRGKPETEAQRIGQRIYLDALDYRRGFRPDQIGIDTEDDVWGEIFQNIGSVAINAMRR